MRARTVPLREALVATATALVVTPAVHAQDTGRAQIAARSRSGSEQQQAPAASPWTKFCAKDEGSAAAAPICITFAEPRLANGQSARVTLIEREGQQRRIMRVVLPGNMNLPLGVRAVIDQSGAFTAASFRCQPSACTAEFNVTPDFLKRLEGGRILSFQSVTPTGQAVRFPMALTDFASVHAGPPNDQKALEEQQQKKLQEELQRRAEDMRRNLQQPPDKLQEELERRADEMRRRLERLPVQLPDTVR